MNKKQYEVALSALEAFRELSEGKLVGFKLNYANLVALTHLSKWKQALTAANELSILYPHAVQYFKVKEITGGLYYTLKLYGKSVEQWDEVRTKHPNYPQINAILFGLSWSFYLDGKYAQASEVLQQKKKMGECSMV